MRMTVVEYLVPLARDGKPMLSCCTENFQNDRLELYEEPTIEEMEAAIEELEQENSIDSFEFVNEEEEMNQSTKRRHQDADGPSKRTRTDT